MHFTEIEMNNSTTIKYCCTFEDYRRGKTK